MSKGNPVIVYDSITQVAADQPSPPVAINGSHGGLTAAVFAIQKNVKAAIFNDAGIGKDQAGIAGLELLDQQGIFAACVDTFTARIGLGNDTLRGTISYANRLAQNAGVNHGQKAEEAAELMAKANWNPQITANLKPLEVRETVLFTQTYGRRIVTLDSNSMIKPEYKDDVVLTGSHGGLVGELPAIKYPVLAVFYNDAGVGKNNAGISKLPWLQEKGIIGATVDANTCRIGIGLDTYEFGVVSYVNDLAADINITQGMKASEAVQRIIFQEKS